MVDKKTVDQNGPLSTKGSPASNGSGPVGRDFLGETSTKRRGIESTRVNPPMQNPTAMVLIMDSQTVARTLGPSGVAARVAKTITESDEQLPKLHLSNGKS